MEKIQKSMIFSFINGGDVDMNGNERIMCQHANPIKQPIIMLRVQGKEKDLENPLKCRQCSRDNYKEHIDLDGDIDQLYFDNFPVTSNNELGKQVQDVIQQLATVVKVEPYGVNQISKLEESIDEYYKKLKGYFEEEFDKRKKEDLEALENLKTLDTQIKHLYDKESRKQDIKNLLYSQEFKMDERQAKAKQFVLEVHARQDQLVKMFEDKLNLWNVKDFKFEPEIEIKRAIFHLTPFFDNLKAFDVLKGYIQPNQFALQKVNQKHQAPPEGGNQQQQQQLQQQQEYQLQQQLQQQQPQQQQQQQQQKQTKEEKQEDQKQLQQQQQQQQPQQYEYQQQQQQQEQQPQEEQQEDQQQLQQQQQQPQKQQQEYQQQQQQQDYQQQQQQQEEEEQQQQQQQQQQVQQEQYQQEVHPQQQEQQQQQQEIDQRQQQQQQQQVGHHEQQQQQQQPVQQQEQHQQQQKQQQQAFGANITQQQNEESLEQKVEAGRRQIQQLMVVLKNPLNFLSEETIRKFQSELNKCASALASLSLPIMTENKVFANPEPLKHLNETCIEEIQSIAKIYNSNKKQQQRDLENGIIGQIQYTFMDLIGDPAQMKYQRFKCTPSGLKVINSINNYIFSVSVMNGYVPKPIISNNTNNEQPARSNTCILSFNQPNQIQENIIRNQTGFIQIRPNLPPQNVPDVVNHSKLGKLGKEIFKHQRIENISKIKFDISQVNLKQFAFSIGEFNLDHRNCFDGFRCFYLPCLPQLVSLESIDFFGLCKRNEELTADHFREMSKFFESINNKDSIQEIDLDLSETKLTDEGVKNVTESLAEMNQVTKLILQFGVNSKMTQQSASFIASAIRKFPQLKSLSLQLGSTAMGSLGEDRCQLSDLFEVIQNLNSLDNLKNNTKLKEIDAKTIVKGFEQLILKESFTSIRIEIKQSDYFELETEDQIKTMNKINQKYKIVFQSSPDPYA